MMRHYGTAFIKKKIRRVFGKAILLFVTSFTLTHMTCMIYACQVNAWMDEDVMHMWIQ